MKRFSIIRSFIALMLAMTCILGCTATAFAANADNLPYGYTYDDAASGRTVYKYFSYNNSKDSYVAKRTFYSSGNTVCFSNGNVVTNASAGTGYRYNGFSTDGIFYAITSKGELLGIGGNNKVITVLSSGAIELCYNTDDLAVSVSTSSGTKSLSDWKDVSDSGNNNNNNQPNVPTTPNQYDRVEVYTNSAEEMVYDAYKGNTLKVSIVLSSNGKHILNATEGVRLSDILKGVKFMGIDTDYNVYMYETNGTLYRFKFGNWYSAEKVVLDGAFKTYKTDKNGFISQIVTDKTTYNLKQLTISDKWKASKTYVVTKDTYATLYIKDTVESTTLALANGVLTLNGKEVDDTVSAFGFISDTTFCYIRNGRVYKAPISDSTNTTRICTGASDFRRNDVGLTTTVVLTNGKTTNIA